MIETRIGDVLPWEPATGFLGRPLLDKHGNPAPQWFILTGLSQKEAKAKAKLARYGIAETWYPTETAWRIQRNAKRDRVAYERLIAPGYIFALTDREIHWHRLFDLLRGFVTGVVGDERPQAIPEATIARMRLVPKRIEMLREEETAREKAARLARLPSVGQSARLTEGPWAGRLVAVERIDRGIAAFLMEGTTIKGTAAVDKLERVVALS